MARKLATIQKVKEILPIENADAIEIIRFENIGWQCVAKKGEVSLGSLGVYFEVDSLLPENKRFEFLRPSSFREMYTGHKGFRLRTIKLRGALSQGLFLPLSLFPEISDKELLDEVTEELNVIKWEREPETTAFGDIIGDYPAHTPKSDQDRIQNCMDYFKLYKGISFERTMKLEGTSTTYHWFEGELSASSHNTTFARNNKFAPWKYVNELGLESVLKDLGINMSIQGEFMGPKIQGNIEKFTENKFFVYNIWDIDKGDWYSSKERLLLIEKINELLPEGKELLHVPVIDENIKIFDVVSSLEEILEMADEKSINAKYREGDVYKSIEKVDGKYIQFKVISNKYLLKVKD